MKYNRDANGVCVCIAGRDVRRRRVRGQDMRCVYPPRGRGDGGRAPGGVQERQDRQDSHPAGASRVLPLLARALSDGARREQDEETAPAKLFYSKVRVLGAAPGRGRWLTGGAVAARHRAAVRAAARPDAR